MDKYRQILGETFPAWKTLQDRELQLHPLMLHRCSNLKLGLKDSKIFLQKTRCFQERNGAGNEPFPNYRSEDRKMALSKQEVRKQTCNSTKTEEY